MNYWQFRFTTNEPDILTAFVGELPFDMFQETEAGFDAWMPASHEVQLVENELIELQSERVFQFEKEFHPSQNWNEIWETNFHPVIVEDWVGVRADFHEPISGVRHELVINPKMAFGTGHHETTWMCLHTMRDFDFSGKKVLDFGCGSGILGILALRLGATEVEAIDIEFESFLNTQENALKNSVQNLTARQGILENVEGSHFDFILANINRNVILDSAFQLAGLCRPSGWLIASGFLKEDESIVVDVLWRIGFQLNAIHERGNWLCLVFQRRV